MNGPTQGTPCHAVQVKMVKGPAACTMRALAEPGPVVIKRYRVQPLLLHLSRQPKHQLQTDKHPRATSLPSPGTPNAPQASRRLVGVHVGAGVDGVGQHLDLHVEAVLHLVEHLAVRLAGHKGDGQALGAEAAGAAHPVQRRRGAEGG
jgi:hypothetical protein